jgi:RNA polymerase sigma factor (sigma-70 family)
MARSPPNRGITRLALRHVRYSELDLPALMARCRAGDQDAMSEMVFRHRRVVLAALRAQRLSADDIEDVAQVTWGKFADHLHTIRDPQAVPAWLASTARNEAVRVLRLRGREIAVDASALEQAGDEQRYPSEIRAEQDEHRERAIQVRRAIDALPERERSLVLFMLAYPDASYLEISAALAMPVGSIGPIRARAFSRLRASLQPAGITGALVES